MNQYERFEGLKAYLEAQFDNLRGPLAWQELLKAFLYSIGQNPPSGVPPERFIVEPKSWGYDKFGISFRVARSQPEAQVHIRPHSFLIAMESLISSISSKGPQAKLF